MHDVQTGLGLRSDVRFISLTADPGFDGPTVLRKYAERHGADTNRWFFLTGPKPDVYTLAINGLKFSVLDKTEQKVTDEDLFVHSTLFVLVDKRGWIRGYFEGTDDGARRELVLAIKQLQRER